MPKCHTVRSYWARDNWVNEMNFGIDHAPGAQSLAEHVDQSRGCII